MSELAELVKMLKKNESSGSDYTGTVTRVEDGIAYVQLSGAAIKDTPASMSISAQPGDKVRVRIAHGKAWLTGNDTAPPTYDAANIERINKENKELDNRTNHIESQIDRIGELIIKDKMVVRNANNSYFEITSSKITLPPGTYIIIADGEISSGVSNSEVGLIVAKSGEAAGTIEAFAIARTEQVISSAFSNNNPYLSASGVVSLIKETSYSVYMKNGNISTSFTAHIKAVRIAPATIDRYY